MNRSDSDKNERKVPPCGRLIEYSEPHSPLQKLIDARRKQLGLSGRHLADRLGVSQSTLWIWLHNRNGYPHPKSCKPEHLIKISEVLKIPEAKLKSALDASRRLFTRTTDPLLPYEASNPFDSLIGILENDPRKSLSTSYVVNLAKSLLHGAKVTLSVLCAVLALQTVSLMADDQETFVTVSGKRYDKVRVTEVTPVTIAFRHSTGVARLPITDFRPDVQKKFGYDEAKARAWLLEQAQQTTKAEEAQRKSERGKREQLLRNMEAVEEMKWIADAVYDPQLHRWFRNRDEAQAAREQAMKHALQARWLATGR